MFSDIQYSYPTPTTLSDPLDIYITLFLKLLHPSNFCAFNFLANIFTHLAIFCPLSLRALFSKLSEISTFSPLLAPFVIVHSFPDPSNFETTLSGVICFISFLRRTTAQKFTIRSNSGNKGRKNLAINSLSFLKNIQKRKKFTKTRRIEFITQYK